MPLGLDSISIRNIKRSTVLDYSRTDFDFRLRFYRFPILYRLGIGGFLQSEFQTFRGFARRIPCTMATSANDFRYDLAMDDGRRQRCY